MLSAKQNQDLCTQAFSFLPSGQVPVNMGLVQGLQQALGLLTLLSPSLSRTGAFENQ